MPLKIKARRQAPPEDGGDYGDEPLPIEDDPDLDSPAFGTGATAAAAASSQPRTAARSPGRSARRGAALDIGDSSPQQSGRIVAGKAAVKAALAGALAAPADPFSGLQRGYDSDEGTGAPPREPGAFWRFLVNTLILIPWSAVLLLSWVVNKWQLLWRPIGAALWWSVDYLDQRAPSVVDWMLWGQGLASLTLHVVTVGVDLGVIWIMWDNGSRFVPIAIIAFYGFAHYAMAVVMFKELDLREQGGTYFSDVLTFWWRLMDVLFFDIQLCASVVHSNRMMESMTQLMFKGYEEARVALTALLFTVPCCVLIGVEYGVFEQGTLIRDLRSDIRSLDILTSYRGQLYAAVCLSVLNSTEKILRLSVVDPWLHEKNDGFPILYVRSHAARLPAGLVRDWLFRCREMLVANNGRLVLKELYAHYVQQVKERAHALSDPHRAILLRKAIYYFNTRRAHLERKRGAAAASELSIMGRPVITSLVAEGLLPGPQLSKMLADILADSTGLTALDLSRNALDDAAVAGIADALRTNEAMGVQYLDLSGNSISAQGCAAVAELLGSSQALYSLSLSGCPVRDEGAVAVAEALKSNIGLFRLDLSDTMVGPECAIALATALRSNAVLSILNLSGSLIGNQGVDAICRALRSNAFLRELDLSRVALDDRGAAAVAQMVAANKGLERLGMARTGATDQGAQLICNALQSNSTLQVIDVSDSPHMDPSWQKLLNHVAKGKPRG